MSNDAWSMERRAQDGPNSLELNSVNGELTSERHALHELITQAVSERRFDNLYPDTPDFETKFIKKLSEIRDSDAFKELAASGEVTREQITGLLDEAGLERLPVVDPSQHTTMLVTGGPATGKTALVEGLAETNPDVFSDAVRLNPDSLKAILADPAIYGADFDEMAHKEATSLADDIIERLGENLSNGGAPHAVLEGAAPNAEKMSLAMESDRLVVVGGTLDPEIALNRALARYQRTGQDVPTEGVLAGAQKVPGRTPMVFEHDNVEFRMYDTDVPFGESPKLIARFDPETKTMVVTDPDAFVGFVERQGLNKHASAPDELFDPASRTPASISEYLSAYTDKGVTIDFVDPETNRVAMAFTPEGVELNEQLPSNRGNGFFNDLAKEAGTKIISLDTARASAGLDTPGNTRPAASLADNFAGVAAEGVQEASRLARAARLGTNAPVVGPAVGVGAAALTGFAHSGQRDHAEELKNQGILSDEAYEAYAELNSETEAMLYADTGLSTVDPTGLSVVITAGVEIQARGAFKDWADEYAPHLSEEQFQSLAMSMFPDNSARNEMIMEAVDHLPGSKDGQPEFMHDIIDAKNAYMDTRAELARTPIGPGPRHSQLSDEVAQMREDLAQDMEGLMSHPEGIDAILDAVPIEDRMEYVRRLAASEDNLAQFSENHSQIAEYVQAHEDSLTGWFLEEDDILQENPDLLNAYIKERSGISTDTVSSIVQNNGNNEIILSDFSGSDATYTGDPSLAVETAEAGIPVNSALIPPEQIAAASNTFQPQIPQL